MISLNTLATLPLMDIVRNRRYLKVIYGRSFEPDERLSWPAVTALLLLSHLRTRYDREELALLEAVTELATSDRFNPTMIQAGDHDRDGPLVAYVFCVTDYMFVSWTGCEEHIDLRDGTKIHESSLQPPVFRDMIDLVALLRRSAFELYKMEKKNAGSTEETESGVSAPAGQ